MRDTHFSKYQLPMQWGENSMNIKRTFICRYFKYVRNENYHFCVRYVSVQHIQFFSVIWKRKRNCVVTSRSDLRWNKPRKLGIKEYLNGSWNLLYEAVWGRACHRRLINNFHDCRITTVHRDVLISGPQPSTPKWSVDKCRTAEERSRAPYDSWVLNCNLHFRGGCRSLFHGVFGKPE